ncbi:MAG: PilZ domain-containing protein [Nitrospira sp.]|nr:PilZ domain-containing protein [Nitrospira sp.]MBX3332701.1 PilZ domain-containing protein [Nitrospira sp.]MDR4463534.1 PilZ domain-containing protein [Nitrospira sp.]MDR4467460.1 PilZ domain-containing protein [Nitrospira sp.]MDR4470641.1 PilZ domain-containing protein [Nitrospira sp.]
MSSDEPTRPSLESERREYYRITITLPICLQTETDTPEGALIEKSVNLSAGGIGLVVNRPFPPNEILSCTLLLAEQVRFTSPIEVLRVDPLPYPPDTYRLHARFIDMTRENRELLVRHILQFQREHLTRHYSA